MPEDNLEERRLGQGLEIQPLFKVAYEMLFSIHLCHKEMKYLHECGFPVVFFWDIL